MRAKGLAAVALLTAALVLLLLREHRAQSRLSQENESLRQQLDQLAADNERLSNATTQASSPALSKEQLSELLRLRGEVGRLRNENKELLALRAENQHLRSTLAGGSNTSQTVPSAASQDFWPKDSWTFAGYATPEAAFQSALWAASKGDLQNFRASMTGDAQKEVEDDLSKKPENERSDEISREVGKLSSIRLVDKQVLADDVVELTLSMEGNHSETNKLRFRKIGSEWKLAGPGRDQN